MRAALHPRVGGGETSDTQHVEVLAACRAGDLDEAEHSLRRYLALEEAAT